MLLVGWQEGHLACKNSVVGCWHGYLSGARCNAYARNGKVVVEICICPADALPLNVSFAPVNPDWFYLPGFTFLVPAHLDSPEHRPWGHTTVVVVVKQQMES